jgi:hypothetical protein
VHCGRTTAYASITHFRGILEWGMRSATKFKWTISARSNVLMAHLNVKAPISKSRETKASRAPSGNH